MNCDIYQSKVKQNGVNFNTLRGIPPLSQSNGELYHKRCNHKRCNHKRCNHKRCNIEGATIKDATIKDAIIKIGAIINQMNSRRADNNYNNNDPAAGLEEDA
jgi:hypothetical protein